MNAAADDPTTPQHLDRPRTSVSIWRTASASRRWSVKVVDGVTQDELDRLIDMALAADARLRPPGGLVS